MLNSQTLNNPPPSDGGQTPPSAGDPSQQQQGQQGGQTPPPATTTPSGSTGQQQGQQSYQGQQQTSIDSLPPDIQDYIKRLRHENEEANKKAKAEAQAKAQAEEQSKKEQGEWKSLAEQYEAKVKDLEPVASRYQELSTQLSSQIDKEIKDWPQSVRNTDPGKDVPIEQRIAWRNNAQAIIADLQGQARAQTPGNPPNPRSVGQGQQQQAGVEELRQRFQAARGNIF